MPEAPAATPFLSTTSTSWPCWARCQAVDRPWTPAPMTRCLAEGGTVGGIAEFLQCVAYGATALPVCDLSSSVDLVPFRRQARAVAIRSLDLGPCAATLHEGDPGRCVVLLPGMRYGTQAPLLWYARAAARAQGWSALEVVDGLPDDEEPFAWARDRAERALDAVPGARAAGGSGVAVVVVGKSLASGAAGVVADRGL